MTFFQTGRGQAFFCFFTDLGLVTKKSSLWAFVYVLLVSTLHCTYSKVNFWVVMWQALWRFKYDLSLLFGGCPRLLKPPLKGCFWKKADLFFSLERLVSFWRCPRQSSFWSDVLTYLRTYLLQHGSDWVRATGGGRCPTQFKLLLQPTLHRHSVAAQWAYYSGALKSIEN